MAEANVSVIIPCYKCADTIGRAVASVWEQTLRPKEILLIEDDSPDNHQTLETLQALQRKYDQGWIKVIPLPENHGPGYARNIGWSAASLPYIAFLDADESWHPRKIEIQYTWMMNHPDVDLTGHLYYYIGNKYEHQEIPDKWGAVKISPIQLLFSNRFRTSSVMLRKSISQRFDPNKRCSEDYLLWLQMVMAGSSMWFLEVPVPLTYLYKAPFGEGGLSGDLWAMEKGELNTYKQLQQLGHLNMPEFIMISAFSLTKYVRRRLVTLLSYN